MSVSWLQPWPQAQKSTAVAMAAVVSDKATDIAAGTKSHRGHMDQVCRATQKGCKYDRFLGSKGLLGPLSQEWFAVIGKWHLLCEEC